MATMKEMVNEYNELTGRSIKSFANRAIAKKYLANANKVRLYQKVKVIVKGVRYNSVQAAFRALGLPLNYECTKFREKLKVQKEAKFNKIRFRKVK